MPDIKIIIFAIYLAIVNVLAFDICRTDRHRIDSGTWRYPPSAVIVYSMMGGTAGAILGILAFRYKIRHKAIIAAVSGLFTIQLGVLIFITILHPFS